MMLPAMPEYFRVASPSITSPVSVVLMTTFPFLVTSARSFPTTVPLVFLSLPLTTVPKTSGKKMKTSIPNLIYISAISLKLNNQTAFEFTRFVRLLSLNPRTPKRCLERYIHVRLIHRKIRLLLGNRPPHFIESRYGWYLVGHEEGRRR